MADKTQTFESSLKRLEEIVGLLEEGELSLEESLKLFEDGVKLSRACQEKLDRAERRIEVLIRDEKGNPSLEPINENELTS